MFLNNNTYDILIVIDFNMKPIKRKKGSAIFIHVSKKKYNSTAGCIGLSKKDLRNLIKKIDKNTSIRWGTYRRLINNAGTGVSLGHEKILNLRAPHLLP